MEAHDIALSVNSLDEALKMVSELCKSAVEG
ncbi:hypothetical protein SDC9_162660 [bioreactor metagenome]|uniref:Uncharacterized protein n=1 Tax=bioreactor metagenome TaxID=1076179 RepID=A0A645FPN7_9ZZZZ